MTSPSLDPDEVARQLNTDVTVALDRLASLRTISKRKSARGSQWLSPEARSARIERRRLERRNSNTRSRADWPSHRQACRLTSKLLRECRGSLARDKVSKLSDNPRLLWSIVQRLLHPHAGGAWYDGLDTSTLAVGIQAFFVHKVNQVKTKIATSLRSATDCQFIVSDPDTPTRFLTSSCKQRLRR